jgi:TRAP-type mannitol/chloroaromatic compound transport system permease small subunit
LRDEQIRVDLIDGFITRRTLTALKALSLILAIVLLAIMAANIYQPMLDASRFGDVKYDLGVPLYPLYGLIIFSFAVSITSCLAAITRQFRTGEG